MGWASTPPAPDYTPVANASKEAAEISERLGNRQLDESRRIYDRYVEMAEEQFDRQMDLAAPIARAQADLMTESLRQGQDYYEYGKTFRPLEQSMLGVAADWQNYLQGTKTERDRIEGQATKNAEDLQGRATWFDEQSIKDFNTYTGGNAGIVARYGADIDQEVGTAVADARAGQAQAQNSMIREAMRYGIPMEGVGARMALQGASQIAATANNTRTGAIDRYRGLVRDGLGVRDQLFRTSQLATADAMDRKVGAMTTGRNQRIQDEGVAWGRGLDMAGLGRGMVGASQGAYGLAVGAGNSAVANNASPSNSLLSSFGNAGSMYQSGMAQGANTIMSGRQMALGGLTNVTNMQQQYALNSGTDLAGLGAVLGGGAQIAGLFSDARLKVDIVPVERDAHGVQWVEFSYVGVPGRVRGVIAQDVAKIVPAAVSTDKSGFLKVDYAHL